MVVILSRDARTVGPATGGRTLRDHALLFPDGRIKAVPLTAIIRVRPPRPRTIGQLVPTEPRPSHSAKTAQATLLRRPKLQDLRVLFNPLQVVAQENILVGGVVVRFSVTNPGIGNQREPNFLDEQSARANSR